MRAWQVTAAGEPRDVLRLVDVDVPEPGPGQRLVAVRAVALNFPDVLLCRGVYQIRPALPFTPGVEICGVDAVTGERVIGTPALPHGGLAEYAVLDDAETLPAPASLDDAAAASFHIAYQTGWFAVHRRAGLRAGETLLVHAAAGGVGSAAVQLGKAAGARVIAVVGGPTKADVARGLGADVVVDRRAEDFVAVVKEVTGGRGTDVVFDPVGGAAFTGSTKCIAFEGRIVVVGFAGGDIPTLAANHVLIKNYAVLGLHWGAYRQHDPDAVRHAHEQLTALADAGVAVPLVSERLDLADAADGIARLAAGDTVGRVVVDIR